MHVNDSRLLTSNFGIFLMILTKEEEEKKTDTNQR